MKAQRNRPSAVALLAGFLMCCAPPAVAQPQTSPDVQQIREALDRLRQEFDAVKQQYDQRLLALEARLGELGLAGGGAAEAPQPPGPTAGITSPAAPPTGTSAAPGDVPQLPAPPVVSAAKIFNPDIAVIGNFVGSAGRNAIDARPPLELSEAEASFQAVVDPYAKADFFFAYGPEGAEIEEGFLTFTTLPAGLLVKVGKMRAGFGKVNAMHAHILPWVDRPLVTQNLVGGEEGVSDAGFSVSRLILNPLFFLEATGEVYRGANEVFASSDRRHLLYLGRLRGYRDLTEGTNLDIGASIAYGPTDAGPDTSARLVGLDATFRYRPLRRAIYKRFIARTELMWSRQDPDAPVTGLDVDFTGERQHAFGFYASGEYQFARRWFAAGRYDHAARPRDAAFEDKGGSVLLTFWPSEFSQIRGQFRRTHYAEGTIANELLFQFLFSIGAHGAHVF